MSLIYVGKSFNQVRTVKVYWDSEWDEFICKPAEGFPDKARRPASWHHTDSRDDAAGTSLRMVGEHAVGEFNSKFNKLGNE